MGILCLAILTLLPSGEADMTRSVLDAVGALRDLGGGSLRLASGEYHFRSPVKRPWYVSNHDNDLPRDVFLPIEAATNVVIESERAELVFHGCGIAVGVVGSENVRVKGVSIDYSRPHDSEWRFVGFEDGRPVLETDPAHFPFSTEGGRLRTDGECMHADELLAVVFGGDDHEKVCADWVTGECERLSDRRVKLLTRIDRWRYTVRPEEADAVFVMRTRHRPSPAVFASRTEKLTLEDVVVRSSPGMGIICQLSGDITIRGSGRAEDRTAGAFPRAGSGRLTPLQADATHFSNCRGKVTVENCLFERMSDDAINVHSTCLKIDRLEPPNRLVAKFVHRQSRGLDLFSPGETVRFIRARTLEAGAEAVIRRARLADPETYELELEGDLPRGYGAGDAVESADWQPEVRFANNIVNRNISRAALFTTPRRVVCESNRLIRVAGSAVKLSGDSMNWYETGGCRDVVIRGNRFENCCASRCRGVIAVDPEIADPAAQRQRYHRNLLIEDNVFDTHDVPLVWAKSVSNVVVRNNLVRRNRRYRGRNRSPYHFEYSGNVTVNGTPAEECPEATTAPEKPVMLLISGDSEVSDCEEELDDIAAEQGALIVIGNARGWIRSALHDGRWQQVLLDEDEATGELLAEIAKVAPHLRVIIQTRRTRASDWAKYETVAVGEATGRARAAIWANSLFSPSAGHRPERRSVELPAAFLP